MGSTSASSGRLRLWLRSERALGLSALPVRLVRPASSAGASAAVPASTTTRMSATIASARAAVAQAFAPAAAAAPAAASARAAALEPAAASGVGTGGGDGSALFDASLAAPFASPVLPSAEKARVLAELEAAEVRDCRRCGLCAGRRRTVFGEGDVDAPIMFVGDGPGLEEDAAGRPFVGRAGQKLAEMIAAMGLRREGVYLTTLVKCRLEAGRVPVPSEASACLPYLERQAEVVRPRAIVALGLTVCKHVLRSGETMRQLRGRWHRWHGIPVMPTYHPQYVLERYTPENRRAVWNDLKAVMAEAGLGGAGGRAGPSAGAAATAES